MQRIITLLAALALLVLGTFGAAAQLEDPVPAEDAAYIRIAHLSPDTPAVKAFVNGEAKISGLLFGSVTRWIDVAPGSYEFAIGTGSDPAAAQISGIALDLAAGEFVTLVVVGSTTNGTLKGQAIVEDYSRIGTGNARVTVFHAMEDGALVNVSAAGASVASKLAYTGAFTAPDGSTNDGLATVEVAAGTGLSVVADNTGAAVFEDAEAEIAAGTNYFVAVTGTTDAPEVVVVESDQSVFYTRNFATGEARVRVAHLSAATAPVTIFVDGQIVLSGLRFGFASRFLPVQAGSHEIAVSPNSGFANAIIGPVDWTFEEGKFYTIAAIAAADGSVTATVIEDFTAGDEGSASVTVFHGIAGGPVIDVAAGDVELVASLAHAGTFQLPAGGFNDGIIEASVAAGDSAINVYPANSDEALLSEDESFVAGNYYLVAIVNGTAEPRVVIFATDPAVDLSDDNGF